jgi:hypothetical protein
MEWAPEQHAVTVQALWPLSPKLDGNLPCCHIGDHHWDKERANAADTLGNKGDSLSSSVSIPQHQNQSKLLPVPQEEHAYPNLHQLGKGGSSHSKLGKAVHAAGVFSVHEFQRIEIRHLPGDLSK